ncbi:MAG: RNA polymerase sigma factor [Candidatus Aminicenantes bacterium]|nr:RNA polymerase sigma factor [Candidatus Aminicenantes bacterium]
MTEEKELIDRLSRGEMTAFRELVETYKKKMYTIALDMVGNPADAEDVSQEVFLKAFRSFKTFKRDAKLSSWLYRIATNASIDHLRRRALAPQAVEDTVLDASSAGGFSDSPPSQDPAQAAESKLLQARIEKALEKVSPQERAVFLLRHYNDLMLDEIAETMRISVGSVKSYLFRCIRKLQKELSIPGRGAPLEVYDEKL